MSYYSSKIALLAGTIDYAGMFPPASLDLNATLQKAATFRTTAKHPWLMNRVVLSLAEVKKLNAKLLYECGSNGSPWNISVLSTPHTAISHTDFVKCVDWDFREMRRTQERYNHSSAKLDLVSYEIKLPDIVTSPGQAITSGEYIFPALEQIETIWPGEMDVYFEVGLEGAWQETLEGVTRIMSEWLNENSQSPVLPGLKIRTGGKFVPKPEQLAMAIDESAANGVKIKATQGMHHPLTHSGEFGFVNFFAAVNFAYSWGPQEFSLKDIENCLCSEDAKDFVFSEASMLWKGRELTFDQIESARKTHAAALGSCSLDEPDQFLLKEFP
ncbi:MAG: hypothetical protein EBQ92_11280 [Proteobacteria bacterium]|nr:hypothetical protein [Pseudomonadota bacterium]